MPGKSALPEEAVDDFLRGGMVAVCNESHSLVVIQSGWNVYMSFHCSCCSDNAKLVYPIDVRRTYKRGVRTNFTEF